MHEPARALRARVHVCVCVRAGLSGLSGQGQPFPVPAAPQASLITPQPSVTLFLLTLLFF